MDFKNGVAVSEADEFVLSIPKGSNVNFDYTLEMDAFSDIQKITWDMILDHQLDLVVDQNGPTGIYRVDKQGWRRHRDTLYNSQFIRSAAIEPEGIVIVRDLTVKSDATLLGITR